MSNSFDSTTVNGTSNLNLVTSAPGNSFGLTTVGSTAKTVKVVADRTKNLSSIVSKMVYIDVTVDNLQYRSVGTITNVETFNPGFNVEYENVAAKRIPMPATEDLRKLTFNIQATFVQDPNKKKWNTYNSILPTSPSTLTSVNILTPEIVNEIIDVDKKYPTVGYFRGIDSTRQPLNIPDFGAEVGASHSSVIGRSGSGKDLALDTPIPTPTGWTTMGELKTGDEVLSENGETIKVAYVHEILTESVCYKVLSDNGSEITAGGGHLWYIETVFNSLEEMQEIYGTFLTNTPILDSETVSYIRKIADDSPDTLVQPTYCTEHLHALTGERYSELVTILYNKYAVNGLMPARAFMNFFAWWGSTQLINRNTVASVKTTEEIFTEMYENGTEFTLPPSPSLNLPEMKLTVNPYTYGSALTQMNETSLDYTLLRASIGQRQQILNGLFSALPKEYANTNIYVTNSSKIAEYVTELARTLGYTTQTLKDDTWAHKITYSNQNGSTKIVSITVTDTVPTRCITVNSDTSLYLAGKHFTPTHNTAFYTYMLSTYMSHPTHAILVIDPQGQWSSEEGMVMSPQKFAKGLGRDVQVLRVAEDIQLPLDPDLFTQMLNKLSLWKRFQRMGGENSEALSYIVADKIAHARNYDDEPRTILSKVFEGITNSPSQLGRIYVKGERQDDFKRTLQILAGVQVVTEDGEYELISQDELDDAEDNWNSILSAFTPLINLFSSKNLNGGKRTPLKGSQSFLKNVFQVRKDPKKPAPYVILDMSPNVSLNAKADLLGRSNNNINMQKILDNQDIKALMLITVLQEMKEASEQAFSAGGGNLNTQIVFDEAWRYAPSGKASEEIEHLANLLEGFALDTRKYGIGWTYILQSPADLRHGIWKQLTYVYVGYGLAGEDLKRLESLTDDPGQIDLYRQFISPKSTGVYPFMLMGPISPIIFTSSPAFINVFTKPEDFIHQNLNWITDLTKSNGLPAITGNYIKPDRATPKAVKYVQNNEEETKTFKIGKQEGSTKSAPQNITVKPSHVNKLVNKNDGLDDMPF